MRVILALTLLAFAAVLSGCGDESDAPLSHDEYRIALLKLAFSSPEMQDAQRRFFELAAGSLTEAECRDGARTSPRTCTP